MLRWARREYAEVSLFLGELFCNNIFRLSDKLESIFTDVAVGNVKKIFVTHNDSVKDRSTILRDARAISNVQDVRCPSFGGFSDHAQGSHDFSCGVRASKGTQGLQVPLFDGLAHD